MNYGALTVLAGFLSCWICVGIAMGIYSLIELIKYSGGLSSKHNKKGTK